MGELDKLKHMKGDSMSNVQEIMVTAFQSGTLSAALELAFAPPADEEPGSKQFQIAESYVQLRKLYASKFSNEKRKCNAVGLMRAVVEEWRMVAVESKRQIAEMRANAKAEMQPKIDAALDVLRQET